VGLVHKLRVEVFWGKTKFSNIPGEKNAHQRLDCTINLYELSQNGFKSAERKSANRS